MADICLYALAGGLAGLVRDIMRTGGLVLPCLATMPDGARLVRLGFLTAMVIGAGAGVFVDHHLLTAAAAGWAGPDFLETAVNVKAGRRRTIAVACKPDP